MPSFPLRLRLLFPLLIVVASCGAGCSALDYALGLGPLRPEFGEVKRRRVTFAEDGRVVEADLVSVRNRSSNAFNAQWGEFLMEPAGGAGVPLVRPALPPPDGRTRDLAARVFDAYPLYRARTPLVEWAELYNPDYGVDACSQAAESPAYIVGTRPLVVAFLSPDPSAEPRGNRVRTAKPQYDTYAFREAVLVGPADLDVRVNAALIFPDGLLDREEIYDLQLDGTDPFAGRSVRYWSFGEPVAVRSLLALLGDAALLGAADVREETRPLTHRYDRHFDDPQTLHRPTSLP